MLGGSTIPSRDHPQDLCFVRPFGPLPKKRFGLYGWIYMDGKKKESEVPLRKVDPAMFLLIKSHCCFNLLHSHYFMVTVRNKIQPEIKKGSKSFCSAPARVQAKSNKIPEGARRDEPLTENDLHRWRWTSQHRNTRTARRNGVDVFAIRKYLAVSHSSRVRSVIWRKNHEKDHFFTILLHAFLFEVILRISRCPSWLAAQSFSTVSKPFASIQSSAMNFDM